MTPLMVSILAFVGVAALVASVAFMFFRPESEEAIEERLDVLTGAAAPKNSKAALNQGVLMEPLGNGPGFVEAYIMRFFNLSLLLQQANAPLTVSRFLAISGGLAAAGAIVPVALRAPVYVAPITGVLLGIFPLLWIVFRRKRRLKAFAAQMPDSMELIARALRSGHSLASGFSLVATEMADPIGTEFGRVFEEQNLGIPLEDALESLANRIPNLDLKFFSTAVILQRQTGGDLAEILDKIGYLVRERFKIFGQVQALTGEGRLSGVVLLALPPVLFLAVYKLNPEYVSVLFTDPMGKQMLAGAAFMQVLGALVIRKIINIKV
jgi:tight adherence protein B